MEDLSRIGKMDINGSYASVKQFFDSFELYCSRHPELLPREKAADVCLAMGRQAYGLAKTLIYPEHILQQPYEVIKSTLLSHFQLADWKLHMLNTMDVRHYIKTGGLASLPPHVIPISVSAETDKLSCAVNQKSPQMDQTKSEPNSSTKKLVSDCLKISCEAEREKDELKEENQKALEKKQKLADKECQRAARQVKKYALEKEKEEQQVKQLEEQHKSDEEKDAESGKRKEEKRKRDKERLQKEMEKKEVEEVNCLNPASDDLTPTVTESDNLTNISDSTDYVSSEQLERCASVKQPVTPPIGRHDTIVKDPMEAIDRTQSCQNTSSKCLSPTNSSLCPIPPVETNLGLAKNSHQQSVVELKVHRRRRVNGLLALARKTELQEADVVLLRHKACDALQRKWHGILNGHKTSHKCTMTDFKFGTNRLRGVPNSKTGIATGVKVTVHRKPYRTAIRVVNAPYQFPFYLPIIRLGMPTSKKTHGKAHKRPIKKYRCWRQWKTKAWWYNYGRCRGGAGEVKEYLVNKLRMVKQCIYPGWMWDSLCAFSHAPSDRQ